MDGGPISYALVALLAFLVGVASGGETFESSATKDIAATGSLRIDQTAYSCSKLERKP